MDLPERYPAAALVKALKGRTVVDATCDSEGVDDVRLQLDDGTTILIESKLDANPASIATTNTLDRPLWQHLLVRVGGRELWPFSED